MINKASINQILIGKHFKILDLVLYIVRFL